MAELVKMKEQVYKDPRTSEYFDRFHAQARRQPPNAMYEWVRMVLSPIVWFVYRARCIDAPHFMFFQKCRVKGSAPQTPMISIHIACQVLTFSEWMGIFSTKSQRI